MIQIHAYLIATVPHRPVCMASANLVPTVWVTTVMALLALSIAIVLQALALIILAPLATPLKDSTVTKYSAHWTLTA